MGTTEATQSPQSGDVTVTVEKVRTRTVQTVILDASKKYIFLVHETGTRRKHQFGFNKPAGWSVVGGGEYDGTLYEKEPEFTEDCFYKKMSKPYRDVFRHLEHLLRFRSISKEYDIRFILKQPPVWDSEPVQTLSRTLWLFSLIGEGLAEGGYLIRPVRLLKTFLADPLPGAPINLNEEHDVLVYESQIVAGQMSRVYADEINDAGWFSIDKLPPGTYPSHLQRLEAVLPMLGVETKPQLADRNYRITEKEARRI